MRYQEKIYNQTGNKVRNRDHLNVNTSSDICMFVSPTFNIVGADKIITDTDTCEFSGVSFDNVLTSATANCSGMTEVCIDTVDWSTTIYANGDVVYTGDIRTTVFTATPTTFEFVSEVSIGLNSLGYTYVVDDSEISITKPFGVSDIQVDICANISPTVSATCTPTCEIYCESACTQTYDTLTSASTNVYIVDNITGSTGITVTFDFTGNTESFDSNTVFKYEIYKYDHTNLVFIDPAIYKSEDIMYSSFSATSAFSETILTEDINIDGDYLIKGYFVYNVCTDILGRLGLTDDTSVYKMGSQYELYSEPMDYYMVALDEAAIPLFSETQEDLLRPLGSLVAFSILPSDGETIFPINFNVEGDLLVYLNGLMLAEYLDYRFTAENIITLSAATISGDVLTYVSVANSDSNGLLVENIDVDAVVPSGATDGEGTSAYYFNTDTGKYEIFTELTPITGNDIIVTLNGATLAPNIDYYQSITNPRRLILEGNILMGDLINIVYNAYPTYVGEIFTDNPIIHWTITAPELANGIFTVQVATDETFNSIVASGTVNYEANRSAYALELAIVASVGDTLVYRVYNEKNYVSLNGDVITTDAYSEVVPITFLTNTFNSY